MSPSVVTSLIIFTRLQILFRPKTANFSKSKYILFLWHTSFLVMTVVETSHEVPDRLGTLFFAQAAHKIGMSQVVVGEWWYSGICDSGISGPFEWRTRITL